MESGRGRDAAHPLHALSATRDLADEEPGSRPSSISIVRKVRGQDEQRAPANSITDGAVNLRLGGGEVGDTTQVLQVLGVSEDHSTLDLVLDGRAELGQRVADDGGALAARCWWSALFSPVRLTLGTTTYL